MNSSSSEALFKNWQDMQILTKNLNVIVQILAKNSFKELWKGEINGKEYSHSRVYKISGDQFLRFTFWARKCFPIV